MKFSVKRGLSGSALKWIAIVTMLIDDVAASGLVDSWNMRLIGRTAFPLFCFLLAEGAVHTRDMKKYLARLAIFAVLSEVPFDLALWGNPFCWEHQNVYWTLLLGLGVIYLLQNYPVGTAEGWKAALGLVFFAGLAEIGRTDYGAIGVILIVLLYQLREKHWLQLLAGYGLPALTMYAEVWCFPAFVLMAFYNGTRGRQPKYILYAFYPVHLAVIWILKTALGG